MGWVADGKYQVVAKDTAKTKSSRRTLPLTPPIRALLVRLKDQQEENRRLCGNCYYRDYEGYICINEVGRRISPNFLSDNFELILEKNGLRRIRFHDLRHNSASLLLANHVPLKQICWQRSSLLNASLMRLRKTTTKTRFLSKMSGLQRMK